MNPQGCSARGTLWVAAAFVLLVLHGCATTPAHSPGTRSPIPGQTAGGAPEPSPTPAPPPVSPVPGTQVGTTHSGGTITTTAPQPTLVDTLPSADALEVLGTIPEPLPPGERVPPPPGVGPSGRSATSGGTPPAHGSAADSTDRDAEEDADVPVPEPTRPLGDRPRPPPETTSSASGTTSPSPAGGATTQSPGGAPSTAQPSQGQSQPSSTQQTAARPDSCWRVQLAAVPEAERAEGLRAAGQSQLDVPVVIEVEGGLRKVRTRDCRGAAAAEQLRRRAETVGFTGAFRFRRK